MGERKLVERIQAPMCRTHGMYWPDKIRLIPGAYVDRCPMAWLSEEPCELEYREVLHLDGGWFDDCMLEYADA